MERFAFKGVACNLVTYLTDVVKMRNSSAAKTVNTWCGITSMLPLFVAPLADSYWDQYSTILASSSLYFLVIPSSSSFSPFDFLFFFKVYINHFICNLSKIHMPRKNFRICIIFHMYALTDMLKFYDS